MWENNFKMPPMSLPLNLRSSIISVVKTQTNLIIWLGHWLWFIRLLGGAPAEMESDRTYQAPSGLSSPIRLACLPCSWQLLMLPPLLRPVLFLLDCQFQMLLLHCGSNGSLICQCFLRLGHHPAVTIPWLPPFQRIIQEGKNDQHEPVRAPETTSISLLGPLSTANCFSVSKALHVARSPLTWLPLLYFYQPHNLIWQMSPGNRLFAHNNIYFLPQSGQIETVRDVISLYQSGTLGYAVVTNDPQISVAYK